MAMFDDPQKELEQLQKQLLEEEEWFSRELDSAKALLGDSRKTRRTGLSHAASAAGAPRKAPSAPAEPPVRSQANNHDGKKTRAGKPEPAPKQKSVKGLVILAILETLGIVGIAAYWVMMLL